MKVRMEASFSLFILSWYFSKKYEQQSRFVYEYFFFFFFKN